MSEVAVIVHPDVEMIQDSGLPQLMTRIRPQWQSKGLIERVRRLMVVDPSSACQRLLNAAIADLREKINIAGLDIARDAAKANKLPSVERPEDIENYSTANIIDLSYRMGLLTRPEWRRLSRSYEIRRDLEHEDSEYEAGVEDCVYIFKTCIEAVLSRDPVTLIRVSEVKEVIETAGPATADPSLIEDFEHAPDTRQLEIAKFLFSTATNDEEPDLVRQNAFTMIGVLSDVTRAAVTVELSKHVQEKIGRRTPLNELQVRVADAAGVLPYLRKSQRRAFFGAYLSQLNLTGHHWSGNASHGGLLRKLREFGGLRPIPDEELREILKWMVLCYIGEPGGRGMGVNRKVFYSNSGAPLIAAMIQEAPDAVSTVLAGLSADKDVKRACAQSPPVERRYQDLLDLTEE
ncbi:hypothetical protein LZG07_10970 [Microbacterium profundi]|uniref:hypothetical protein n=1 Tax=Microbacterium profundi TaxID=450380 RepID=UPI001F3112EA|nr:hypothetical protein [Microbacterium profundi]MCE7482438.1 hypothetical protein [Microbacterium profundi]